MKPLDISQLDFTRGSGLVTVVAQDAVTGMVLMVAHADREALELTVATGEMHYTSRTRGAWHKGATSGNTQRVVSLSLDCDADAVLARVLPAGPACHTGAVSCFGAPPSDALSILDETIASRAHEDSTDGSGYTQKLLADRNLRLKKVGEEAAELVVACADGNAARAISEVSDLLYHSLVAVRALGISYQDIQKELTERFR